MKTHTVKNSHNKREAAESWGIALMLSGSYVLRHFELAALWGINLNELRFSEHLSVVVTNEQNKTDRGKLAKLAFLSSDRRFARYGHPAFPHRSSVISLRLIKAKAYAPREFLTRVKGNKALHVRRRFDGREWFGILFGSHSHKYSSLVVPADTPIGFDLIDIETQSNPYNEKKRVKIIGECNSVEKQSVLAALLRKYGLH